MDWRFSTFLLSLFALLIGITWATSDAGMCSSAYVKGVLADRTKDGALNCFEFWFNRYQSLAGAIIALVAAWIATIPARGQLREMARQSAASARQSTIELANSFEAEMLLTRKIGGLWAPITVLIESYDRDPWSRIYDTWPQRWREHTDEVRSCFIEFSIMMARVRAGDPDFKLRISLAEHLDNLNKIMCEIDQIFYASTGGPDYENGGRDFTEDEANKIRENFDIAFDDCMQISKQLHDAVVSRFTEAWQKVREIEQRLVEP